MKRFLAPLSLYVLLSACRPETYVPKPRGYYEVSLPQHEYQKFDEPGFPYSFEYPVYGRIVKDTNFFGQKPENPYWISVDFPQLGGQVYISYKQVSPSQPYAKLLEDSYEMTQFHTKKADYIGNASFSRSEERVYGELYNVTGNAASAYQFYAGDSAHHFLRGALYFDVTPNADSLKPINEFLRKDMERMLQTLRWK